MAKDSIIRTTETITPELAEKYLNANKINRPLRSGRVEKYAADMLQGTWTACAAPIIFYESSGDLADGQHRLYAIVESQIPQTFAVWRNFPRDAALNIDTGAGRTFADNHRIGTGERLQTGLISCARYCEWATTSYNRTPTNAETLEVVEKHRTAAKFAVTHAKGRGLMKGCLTAAIARAWYHEADRATLDRFAVVFFGGFSDGPHESAAIAVRNFAQQIVARGIDNNDIRKDLFLRMQTAIKYFMKGKPMTISKSTTAEPYPLKK